MTVTYAIERTGRGPETAERLLTTSCPSCGADWTVAGNGLPRPGVHRSYWCTACGELHDATLVRTQRSAPPPPKR